MDTQYEFRQDTTSNPQIVSTIHNTSKLNLLALAHSPNLAGAQLALASLIKNTSEQIDWTVISPGSGPFVEKIDSLAEVIITEKYPWWCRGKTYDAPPIDFQVEELNEVFDSIDYDYAMTNTITIPWLAYNSLKRSKAHMWYIHEYGDIDQDLSFALGYDSTVGYIQQTSDVVITVSQSVGDHLLAHGITKNKLRYISQSFEIDSYIDMEPPTENRELLILGSIKKSKGQLDALEAFSKSRIHDNSRLTIAGPVTEPLYAKAIEQYITTHQLDNNVEFIPKRVNALEYMRQASTVLVCSQNEALGRITLEALAAGRTVIGSSGGGTETLLAESRGILYDGSLHDLIDKLDALAESGDRNIQFVDKRRQYVIDNYSPSNERNDFLEAVAYADEMHENLSRNNQQSHIGKTGIFSALKLAKIIA